MLVAYDLIYVVMLILLRSLLESVLILLVLLANIGAFVVVAATGRALDLSALIGLLMLRGIVVTNTMVSAVSCGGGTLIPQSVMAAHVRGGRPPGQSV
jgi:multidrug efflux pump subunit AcrB